MNIQLQWGSEQVHAAHPEVRTGKCPGHLADPVIMSAFSHSAFAMEGGTCNGGCPNAEVIKVTC
ncbi:MAG: hypothetical protein IBX39_04650 [Candidatus Methanoperedenaceae archaeon]|nr:hypothetical protein [Candidatus Methanoperedenaceae archaeon]